MPRFAQLLKRLHDQQIDFVVVGGVAAALHGSSVATYDVDVCLGFTEENVLRILRAVEGLDPRLRHRPDRMPLPTDPDRLRGLKNLYLDTSLGQIDLLGELPGYGDFASLADKTITMDLGGFACRVLNLDALIESKTRAGRPKDRLAVNDLEAIRRQRKTGP